jgi:hypothetical protein
MAGGTFEKGPPAKIFAGKCGGRSTDGAFSKSAGLGKDFAKGNIDLF